MSPGTEKSRLAARIESRFEALVDLCRALVRVDSRNPPGDTTALVETIEAVLDSVAGIERRRVVGRAPAVNLVARVRGAGPGRRLVLNGHLDPFPIGEARWSHHPLSADLEDGRIYGRGACDMKAGVAALVLAFVTLAEFRLAWSGEAVLALVGDEETGGRWGTQYLLANLEEAVGDAMLNADTGSPDVVRIGEKGDVWLELEATGIANHAAHIHLGRNAVDALLGALVAVRALGDLDPVLPEAVERAIAEAKATSEPISGEGEARTLRRVTVNIGRIEGGIGVNTIPDRARALCDIRIPPGVTVAEVKARLASAIEPHPDVSWRIVASTEPSWTDPEDDIVPSGAQECRSGHRARGSGQPARRVLRCPVLPSRRRSKCRLRRDPLPHGRCRRVCDRGGSRGGVRSAHARRIRLSARPPIVTGAGTRTVLTVHTGRARGQSSMGDRRRILSRLTVELQG